MTSNLDKSNANGQDSTPEMQENSREYSTFKAKYDKLSLNKPITVNQQVGNTI